LKLVNSVETCYPEGLSLIQRPFTEEGGLPGREGSAWLGASAPVRQPSFRVSDKDGYSRKRIELAIGEIQPLGEISNAD
jgi:hypothetical protein